MNEKLLIKISAIFGITFPVLALILILLLGSMIPGYSHTQDYISEIWKSGSEFQLLALILLVIMGGIFLVFSLGFYLAIDEDKYSYYNLILLITFSISLIFLGVFPCPGDCMDNGFTLHFLFTIIACASLGFSPLLLYFVTEHDKKWKNYEKLNLIAFFTSISLLFLYALSGTYKGLFQRLYFFICFFWVGIVSIKLFKLSKTK